MKIGQTILHYKILEKLGEGGMGIVYKAEDLKLKRTVALKFMSPFLLNQARTRTRLEREAQAAAALNHTNICTIHEFHKADDASFIVMEYIQGETLKQIIDRDGPIPQEKAKAIILQIAEALAVAHKNGVIHRDIKSENIMIMPDGRAKVMDFGLAKLQDAPIITKSATPIGTLAYMSPELVQGKKVDHRTDLWSLGVVFFEMLTGELPFKADSDVGVMYSIVDAHSLRIERYSKTIAGKYLFVITRLLQKNVTERYQSAEEVTIDLADKRHRFHTKLLLQKLKRFQKSLVLFVLAIVTGLFIVQYYNRALRKPPWFKQSAKPKRLTDEAGSELGKISPNGSYLAFINHKNEVCIKSISDNRIVKTINSKTGSNYCPIWSPSGDSIAFISSSNYSISILDLAKTEPEIVPTDSGLQFFHLDWSPNGKSILYMATHKINNEYFYTFYLFNTKSGTTSSIYESSPPNFITQTAWFPNNQHFAFFEFEFDSNLNKVISKVIRTYNIENCNVSPPVIAVKYLSAQWLQNGLEYSPDGKFLVYPEKVDGAIELVALPVKESGTMPAGKPMQVTDVSGYGLPFWPCFTRDGRKLVYGLGRRNRDIYVASLELDKNRIADRTQPIASNKESIDYDACWSLDGEKIAYLSDKGDRTEIVVSDSSGNKLTGIIVKQKPDGLVKFMPSGKSLSFLSSGELWGINLKTNLTEKIFPKQESNDICLINSYDWSASEDTLFALISSKENYKWGMLCRILLHQQKIEAIADSIFTPQQSEIQLSPSKTKIAIRSVNSDKMTHSVIQYFDLEVEELKDLASHIYITFNGEISWLPLNKSILFSYHPDSNEPFYYYNQNLNGTKTRLSAPVGGIVSNLFPGQVSPTGDKILMYSEIFGSDIWIQGELE